MPVFCRCAKVDCAVRKDVRVMSMCGRGSPVLDGNIRHSRDEGDQGTRNSRLQGDSDRRRPSDIARVGDVWSECVRRQTTNRSKSTSANTHPSWHDRLQELPRVKTRGDWNCANLREARGPRCAKLCAVWTRECAPACVRLRARSCIGVGSEGAVRLTNTQRRAR